MYFEHLYWCGTFAPFKIINLTLRDFGQRNAIRAVLYEAHIESHIESY